jgi:hypothetical protein
VIQSFHNLAGLSLGTDNGGAAWSGALSDALISSDTRISNQATAIGAARTLDATFAAITPPAGATVPLSLDLVVEGYTVDTAGGRIFGAKTLALRDGATPQGSTRTIGATGAKLPAGTDASAEAIIDASAGVGDALFGLTQGELLSFLTGATTPTVEIVLGDTEGFLGSPAPTSFVDWLALRVLWEGTGDPSFVDMAAVERMIQGRLASSIDDSVVSIVWPDEPNPKRSTKPWARWIALDSQDTGSSKGRVEPDERTFVLTLEVVAPKEVSVARPNAIHAAESELRKAITHASVDELATTGHLLHVYGVDFTQDRPSGKAQSIRSGTLTARGVVERVSGTVLE